MKKSYYLLSGIITFILPNLVLAADVAAVAEKSMFHIFYERTFGPIGAIAGIMAMVVFWQISKKVDKNFSLALKLFVFVLLFINIGSLSFGIHGSGGLSSETTRYIERICRLIALLAADVAALVLYKRIKNKNIITENKEQV